MVEVAEVLEAVTETAAQLGPVLGAVAAEPVTYGLAFAVAAGVWYLRKRKARKE